MFIRYTTNSILLGKVYTASTSSTTLTHKGGVDDNDFRSMATSSSGATLISAYDDGISHFSVLNVPLTLLMSDRLCSQVD